MMGSCRLIGVALLLCTWTVAKQSQEGTGSAQKDDNYTATNDNSAPLTLTVLKEGGNQSSPLLYGIMFEEMDHSGDGGIHGQLLQNNGFQGTTLGLTGYKAIGDVDILEDTAYPVSDAIASSLAVQVPIAVQSYVGFANTGYKGVPVINATYQSEFWMLGDYQGTVTLQLVGSASGITYASHNLTVDSNLSHFTRYNTSFNSTAAPDGNNEWRLLFDGAKVAGSELNFALVQLFAPTYHSRTNGLRGDIAGVVEELHPTFLRFPGGNNIEGLQIESRWTWNETIGPLINRPGRDSDWWYPNTDALGLDEYLWWCEDMDMVPVLAVWDGKSYGEIVSGPELQPYLEDISNELEYLLGPANSTYGKLRAQNGREDPWRIDYIEIGNEDDYTGGCETYPDRFMQIYNTIHSQYPSITIIASTIDELCLPVSPPSGILYDYHYYRSPDDLVAMFDLWDNQPRSQPVIVGEYGCRNTSEEEGVFWSFVQASCSEAVHMIGLERNSDIVKMAAYAPLLQHFGYTQWSPTLIGFDSNPDSITRSTSYYVQRMFATNRGLTTLPIVSTADFGPVYWVASTTNSTYYVKLANYGGDRQTVHVNVPDTNSGILETLSGPKEAYNTAHNITVMPRIANATADNGTYIVNMAPWAVAVLAVS